MSIEEQKAVLENAMSQMIEGDYVYLDVPGYFNIGDQLIFNGAMAILDKAIPYKCVYRSIVENVREDRIPKKVNIILQGGGNWGDGYYTRFRNKIISTFPDNKIIIMPQTIRYFVSDIEKDAKLYASHPNLHLCARDNASYDLLKKHFSANHIYLLPDSAVGLWDSLPKWTKGTQNKSLFLKRLDGEAAIEKWEVNNADVKDWDSILEDLNFSKVLFPYMGIRRIKKATRGMMLKDMANRYFLNVIETFLMKQVPQYFLKYDKLYTTRLHGLILAKLLEMPVEYQDTRYGKISGYCETWF